MKSSISVNYKAYTVKTERLDWSHKVKVFNLHSGVKVRNY